MALIQCNFYSKVLELSTSMNVILPQNLDIYKGNDRRDNEGDFPVLYLLHGLSDDHTGWQRKTSVERYAEARGLAVVIPNVHRSFYTDMVQGNDYWTFLTEELPEIATDFFPLSEKRKFNYVAGLSMGGYGAFKWALRKPDKFVAAASLSGALNMARRIYDFEDNKERIKEFETIFGNIDNIKNSNNDIFYLVKNVSKKNVDIPKLYQCCGTEDFLYDDNIKFKNLCKELGLPLVYEEERAAHEWSYWDKKINDIINWVMRIMKNY